MTRELPSLPTGTPAEGSIQVAGAPNRGTEGSATKERRPPGGAPLRFCRRISPKAFRARFRRLAGRGIAPAARRLAGCCTPIRSSVNRAPQGIWPQAILIENPARRAGSAKRTQAGVAGRSARERPSRVARSGRSPGRPPKPLVPFFGSFLGQARKELAVGRLPTNCAARCAANPSPPRGGTRQAAPLAERQKQKSPRIAEAFAFAWSKDYSAR